MIELWELETPTGLDPIINMQGKYVYPELAVGIISKTRVLEKKQVGFDIVYLLLRSLVVPAGADYSAYIQFDDSRNLYRLDVDPLGAGSLTLVASPDAQSVPPGSPPVPIYPPLALDYHYGAVADHPQYGYVYEFLTDINILSQDGFIIFDSDRDGVFEIGGFLTLNASEWFSGNWSQAETYNSTYW